MTRIVAGFAGSLTLTVPAFGTRPTSERVREAVFSALEARDAIDGCRVLDLYAGSGALGLEAASRGAAHVTLVENSKVGVRTCRANAALVERKAPSGSGLRIEVAATSVQSYLAGASASWDLVLIDPPYDLGAAELDENLAALAPRLSPDAVVVVERATRSAAPTLPEGLELERSKKYGDTTLYWISRR